MISQLISLNISDENWILDGATNPEEKADNSLAVIQSVPSFPGNL